MSDTEILKFQHRKGLGPFIRVEINADYGRWSEARSLRAGIKKVLRGEAEIVETEEAEA